MGSEMCIRDRNASTETPKYNWASEPPLRRRERSHLAQPRCAFVTISNPGSCPRTPPPQFRRWRRKYEQYYLGSDIGVTNIPGQQATISGCVDRELEQHLYNLISDNTPVFTPEPNEDEVTSCMDIIAEWIAERHPLDARRMELFKLPQEPIPTASSTLQTSAT